MATITASSPAALFPRAGLAHKVSNGVSSLPILGLPTMAKRGRVMCTLEEKPSGSGMDSNITMGASLMAAASAVVASAGPAMALVDDRMSTEGTGLPFGLSNNLLGWILFGVFGLIWVLYIIYASNLEEDEESGLSL